MAFGGSIKLTNQQAHKPVVVNGHFLKQSLRIRDLLALFQEEIETFVDTKHKIIEQVSSGTCRERRPD
jgi:hypothetical protein